MQLTAHKYEVQKGASERVDVLLPTTNNSRLNKQIIHVSITVFLRVYCILPESRKPKRDLRGLSDNYVPNIDNRNA